VAFIGEAMVGPVIAIKGVRPDFGVIALVILALSAGTAPATTGGFMLGLVQDLANPSLLGLQALTKTGLGFGLGTLRGRLVYGVPVVEAGVVVLSVLAHDFFFLLVQSNMTEEAFFWPLLTQSLPGAFYSGLVGVPLLRLSELLGILRQED
jgi:rod shape-determining protein MreD